MNSPREDDQIPSLIPDLPAETCATLRFSTGLERLLTGSGESAGAIRLLAVNETLRREAAFKLPAVEAALIPGDEAEVLELLISRAPTYGIAARKPEEWEALLTPYLKALDGLPLGCVARAFVLWDRPDEHQDADARAFYPRPAQLYAFAVRARNELGQIQHRIRKALETAERKAPPRADPALVAAQIAQDIKDGIRNADGTINMANLFKPLPKTGAPR